MTQTVRDETAEREAWNAWREARRRRVIGAEGDLALVDTHWPETDSRFAELPGAWSVRDDAVWLTATEQDGIHTRDGKPVIGELQVSAGEKPAPMLRFAGGSATVVRRGEQFGIRRFDPQAVAIDEFEAIEAFDFAAAWHIPATFTKFATDTTVNYEKMLEDEPVETAVPGELRFTVAGQEYVTTPMISGGRLMLVFADATTGVSSYQPGRFVLLDLPASTPGEAVPVTIDFNRAYLPPCAFSAHYNCPLPPSGHRIAVSVEAGEKLIARKAAE
ncbi:DUF1684 domain-containing protein [Actinoalloteichus hymeniacidonis]|uniref:DUF1684 family protein n=1 Tax=Actinoalloteichus hymeniacidonis TaxID=340345 RepID=A0AAC9HSU1_9PSEU|nr:DUF1684 domain-containing protein [Actinoalloteichus hymeniacidonis]AOS64689.1 hypothetical protein TL08_19490 [Actinoalloteichus hymeniacidonis]MBB5907236.1 hypothetical protein [Actinoalloteichus hymeniacidonis]